MLPACSPPAALEEQCCCCRPQVAKDAQKGPVEAHTGAHCDVLKQAAAYTLQGAADVGGGGGSPPAAQCESTPGVPGRWKFP